MIAFEYFKAYRARTRYLFTTYVYKHADRPLSEIYSLNDTVMFKLTVNFPHVSNKPNPLQQNF